MKKQTQDQYMAEGMKDAVRRAEEVVGKELTPVEEALIKLGYQGGINRMSGWVAPRIAGLELKCVEHKAIIESAGLKPSRAVLKFPFSKN